MRILEIVPEHPMSPLAGIGRYAYELCSELGNNGHQVHVVTIPCPIPHAHISKYSFALHETHIDSPLAVSTESLRDLHTLFVAEALKVADKVGRPDIIHVHGHFSAHLAACLKDIWHVPVIVTCHYYEHGRAEAIGDQNSVDSYRSSTERWLFELADLVICPSQYICHELRKEKLVPSWKVKVIPNGSYREDMSIIGGKEVRHIRKIFADNTQKIVLFAGRLSAEKGPQVLLQAINLLNQSCNHFRLVFVGSGSQRDDLIKMTKHLGLGEKVIWAGHLAPPELFQAFISCDLLVIPSLYEAFGLVAVEAMSLGVPIVASDVGGLGEILSHNQDAILVPPNDAVALAHAIEFVLKDEDLRARLGCNARRNAKNQFGWEVVLPLVVKAFSETLRTTSDEGNAPASVPICQKESAL